ncbi:MAG: hypothetical protein QXI27_01800 [Nitrososphaerota archaeon]
MKRGKKDTLIVAICPEVWRSLFLLLLSDVRFPDQSLAKSLKYINKLISQIEESNELSHYIQL